MKQRCALMFMVLSIAVSSCGLPVPLPFTLTPTPSITPTPTITPSPSPSPTPTQTPTPQPAVLLARGDEALFYGDYDRSLQEYQKALNGAADDPTKMQGLVGVGRSQLLLGQPSVAITTLSGAIARFPSSPLVGRAYYFMGEAYQAQNNLGKAVEAYTQFSALNPGPLDSFIHELRGDLLAASGNANAAREAYELSSQSPRLGSTTSVEINIGRMYAAAADYKNAIRRYLAAYDKTENEYYRSQINLLAGSAYLNLGMPEQAYTRYLDSVNNYPRPYDSYSALVALVNAGVAVDELQRGLVDYYAGQYGYAVEAFNRYLSKNPQQEGTARHFKAMALIALNQPKTAIQEWDTIIQKLPNDKWWVTAWDEKSYTQWSMLGLYREAADTLLDFANRAPDKAETPAYLFEAARILERSNNLAEAAPIWERVMSEYPASSSGWRSLFLAGISYYRLPNLDQALTTFQRALVLSADPEEQSAADFWIAKTYQAQGKPDLAQTYWQQCVRRDPTGFYSVRAQEVLANLQPFGEVIQPNLAVDWAAERRLAEGWVRVTFNLAADTDLSGLGELPTEPRYQRGVAFWELGLYEQGRLEFESLREDLQPDAVNTFRLIQPLLKMGFYRSAILASRQVLTLAGMDNTATLAAPSYFNHIRFGTFFQDLVLNYSQIENLQPFFLFSVLRQESLFEGFANSSAGARGLMQIMPSTGQEVAKNMGWPANFTPDDLYRPLVSIRLGSRYLARQRTSFNGDLFAALAAYNGGPGNASIWLGLAKGDSDLFYEVIRIKETRDYVRQIFEFANLYRLVYEKTP